MTCDILSANARLPLSPRSRSRRLHHRRPRRDRAGAVCQQSIAVAAAVPGRPRVHARVEFAEAVYQDRAGAL